VFVAGLLERAFPKQIIEEPLLKDAERRSFNQAERILEERLKRTSGERYFFYMAVTRAKEKLYLSYPRFNTEGKESLPSFYVDELKSCLGAQNVATCTKELNDLLPETGEVSEVRDLYLLTVDALFERDRKTVAEGDLENLWNSVYRDEPFKAALESILWDEHKAELKDPRVLKNLNKTSKLFSATRLERFATCPFRHFVQNILYLQEDQERQDLSLAEGQILHETLKKLFETLSASVRQWAKDFDLEAAKVLAREILVQEIVAEPRVKSEKPYRRELLKELRRDLRESPCRFYQPHRASLLDY